MVKLKKIYIEMDKEYSNKHCYKFHFTLTPYSYIRLLK